MEREGGMSAILPATLVNVYWISQYMKKNHILVLHEFRNTGERIPFNPLTS